MQKRSDTVIATFNSEAYQPLADITLPRLKRYCKLHNYDLQTELFTGDVSRIGWERFDRVAELLGYYKTVMWCDADALITNPQVKIELFAGALAMSADVHGANTGVFIMRNAPIVRQLLFAICGEYGREHFGRHPWGEQAAFIHLTANAPYLNLVRWVPQRKLNAYPNAEKGWPDYVNGQWKPGDFIVQFAGMPLHRRIEMATRYAAQTEAFFNSVLDSSQ